MRFGSNRFMRIIQSIRENMNTKLKGRRRKKIKCFILTVSRRLTCDSENWACKTSAEMKFLLKAKCCVICG